MSPAFLDTLDISVFTIRTALSDNDRTSFLRIQRAVRNHIGPYSYLEIGSEMGGSLIPYLLDPLCQTATSIDLRPKSMPDERGTFFYYPDNSTEKMRETLKEHIGDQPLTKLSTFDNDASRVPVGDLPAKPHLAMIDGEHTNTSCFSDFVSVLSMVESNAIISFHDSNLVADAILNCEKMLSYLQIPFETVFLPDCVAAIGLRGMAAVVRNELAPYALNRGEYLLKSRNERWRSVAQSMLDAGLFGDLQNAQSKLEEANKALAEAKAALERSEWENSSYKNSVSWAITAPLRMVMTKLRGRRG